MIFDLALTEQSGKEMRSDTYYYRPDYAQFRYINTALLLTCRRVYMETRFMAHGNITFRYWIGASERAAPPSEFL
jgi:hypothetical protein